MQIVPWLEAGGAERTTVDMAGAIEREGFRSLVVSEGGRMVKELEAVGAEWIPLCVSPKSLVLIIVNAFRLKRIIKNENVKLVHARSRAPAWSALLAARMAHVPFVTTYHGIYKASNALKRWYNSVMVRGDAVIANSEWTAAHIAKEYSRPIKRLTVIPRGVNLETLNPDNVAPARVRGLRSQWNAKDGDTVILLPGRLTRWKGQIVLIEALSQLKSQGRLGNLVAVFAGDAQGRGAYVTKLRKTIKTWGLDDVASIPGHVSDMAAAYLAADIVVSASTDPEAFGRVPAEAGVMGKPVIATDHGGARETVLPEISGLLIPPGDATLLAEALEKMIEMGPERRAEMGMEGQSHVHAHYTLDRMCADTIALYRTLLPQ